LDLEKMGTEEIGLSEGESVDSAVDLKSGKGRAADRSPNVVLLTNKRIIHVQGSGDRRETTVVCLESIDSVEISRERRGYGAYVWGVVAFLVAIGIYSVWDQPIGRIAGALAVAAMGVYLVVEHLVTPNRVKATFRAGSSVVQCALTDSRALQEMYVLVNSLFSLKDRAEPETPRRVFALR
jgi:hypothetical protein